MADPMLGPGAPLRHGPIVSPRDKKRIVSEPMPADGPHGDGTGALGLKSSDQPAASRQGQTADESSLAFRCRNVYHQTKQFGVVGFILLSRSGETGRADPWASAQSPHRKAGVLRQNEQNCAPGHSNRLLDSVLTESPAILVDGRDARKPIERNKLYRDSSKELSKLPNLVPVSSGAQEGDQRRSFKTSRWMAVRRWIPSFAN